MRPNQKRDRGLSPLVIRSLGVLAITLVAMTSSPENGIAVPNCSDCPEYAPSLCLRDCIAEAPCNKPKAVPMACLKCYVTKCTDWNCPINEGGPEDGDVVKCVPKQETPVW